MARKGQPTSATLKRLFAVSGNQCVFPKCSAPLIHEGVLTGDVDIPIARELTFYSRRGELFAQLCACVTLIAIIVTIALRRLRWIGRSVGRCQ